MKLFTLMLSLMFVSPYLFAQQSLDTSFADEVKNPAFPTGKGHETYRIS